MESNRIGPKRPFIGVDCSGQPKTPPMIVVATRYSRRERQNKWIVEATEKQIKKYSLTYRNWQEKLYAALFFKAIDHIFHPGYVIHIDKEFEPTKTEVRVRKYLLQLFGNIHAGDDQRQKPQIEFHIVQKSDYVNDADQKSKLAHRKRMRIDEKVPLDWLIKQLDC